MATPFGPGKAMNLNQGLQFGLLEEFALNPDERTSLVQSSCSPGTRPYHLFQLRLVSQELQRFASEEITETKIEEAIQLVRDAERSHLFTSGADKAFLEQIKAQVAVLGYEVKPDLLMKQLDFNPDSITQLNASAAPEQAGQGQVSEQGQDICASLPVALDKSLIDTRAMLHTLMRDLVEDVSSVSVPNVAWGYLLAHPQMSIILLETLTPEKLLGLFHHMEVTFSSKDIEIHPTADQGGLDNRLERLTDTEMDLDADEGMGRAPNQIDALIVRVILRLYRAKKLDFTDGSRHFASLTTQQLEWIRLDEPEVLNNEGFIGLVEKRIFPQVFSTTADDDESRDSKMTVHGEWLERMLRFVDILPPKFNRHKLAVYLMSLEYNLAKGVMDKDKFLNHYNAAMLKRTDDPSLIVNMYSAQELMYWSSRVRPATKARDDEIIEEYLSHFLRIEKSAHDYERYFELKTFLHPQLAYAMLTAPQQDEPLQSKDVEKWSSMLSGFSGGITPLTERTILKFTYNNKESFLPTDPVVFRLKVKNTKRILVRVFEIKTLEYLQQYAGNDSISGDRTPIGQSLDLDGLTPNWEKQLTLDYPPLEIHDLVVELPELENRRGAFVLDMISNGENSTAYFTKGHLDFVEKLSVYGHILTIIDEKKQEIVEDVGVWFNGFYYKTNDDGNIIIPYRRSSATSQKHIFITHNDFTSRRAFSHQYESYALELSCHIDYESLIPGSTAKILLKAILQIDTTSIICPVDLLEQVVLEVASHDNEINSEGTTTTVSDFQLYDDDWTEYNFQVPENLRCIALTLSAKIKCLTTGKHEDLEATKTFSIESNDTDRVTTVHLNNRKQDVQLQGEILTVLRAKVVDREADPDYEILVMGKNGEKRPDVPLELTFEHLASNDPLCAYLRSDAQGIVHLGKLINITEIACGTNSNTWQLATKRQHKYPSVIHGIVGEYVQLPFSHRDFLYLRALSLFRRAPSMDQDRCLLEDVTDHVKLLDGRLVIHNLTPGYYKLHFDGENSVDIIIANAKPASLPLLPSPTAPRQSKTNGLEDIQIDSNPMLEIQDSVKHPLFISAVIDDPLEQKTRIQIQNWTPSTRVCVVASKFLPYKSMFENMAVLNIERPWLKRQAEKTATTFRSGRVLGEEYQYILNRKAQAKHWAGNLLIKPSVLLSPWSVADTRMSKQKMESQNLTNMSARTNAFGTSNPGAPVTGGPRRSLGIGGARRHRSILPRGEPAMLSFFVNTSVVLANMRPDPQTGLIDLAYTELKEGSFLQILVIDGPQAIQQCMAVANRVGRNSGVGQTGENEYQKRDLRFRSPLDYRRHYIGERTGVNLDPTLRLNASNLTLEERAAISKEPHAITLASNGTSASAVRVIKSVSQVYDLMMTLLENEAHKKNLRKFGFIMDWHRFSTAVKNEKFSKWNCHELNLFLYKKDPPYFEDVVKPFVKNKLVKSFIDDYLIDASLEKYTTLKAFGSLTCMEKCLLARRIPRLRPSVALWIRSRVRNTKVASDVRLFKTIMKSGTIQELEAFAPPPGGPSEGGSREGRLAETLNSRRSSSGADSDEDDEFELVEKPSPPAGSADLLSHPPQATPQSAFGASAVPGSSSFGGFGSSGAIGAFGQPAGGLFGTATAFSFGAPAPPPASAALAAPSTSFFGSSTPSPPPPLAVAHAPTPGFGSARSAAAPTPSYRRERQRAEEIVQQQFKPVDLTKEMAETYYWGRQDAAVEIDRQDVNAFWLDFVEWEESQGGAFLSQNFVANTDTFTAAMATLALLNVTFRPKETSVRRSVEGNLVVASLTPAIVFHSSTKELTEVPASGSILVTQQYYQQLERTEYNSKLMTNIRKYMPPDAEFQPRESYGAHVVLMNATPNPMKLHLELQLPQGSISIYCPLESSQDVTLKAHDTFQFEYQFYFPEEGDFTHYPTHVSDYETIIAFANPTVLKVRKPQVGQDQNAMHTTTWNYILTRGSQEQVLQKLQSDPLTGMKVELLIPRLYHDKEFLMRVTNVLRDRHEYVDRIWSVSLVLKAATGVDEDRRNVLRLVSEYLATKQLALNMGDWFTSALLVRRPQSRYEVAKSKDAFHYLEYFPLINARAHKAKKHITILNDRFKEQYERFLTLLAQKPHHDIEDLLVLIVYLLAQDRILEAKKYFFRLSTLVEERQLEGDQETDMQQIQYDYLRAYLSLCVEVRVDEDDEDDKDEGTDEDDNNGEDEDEEDEEDEEDKAAGFALDLASVQAIVNMYQRHPVQRWNKLFKDMKIYVDEIVRSSADTTIVADTAPSTQEVVSATALQETDTALLAKQPTSSSNSKATSATVDFKIESDNHIRIQHRGVDEVIVEYYVIDAETMFSASPLTFSEQGESEVNFAAYPHQHRNNNMLLLPAAPPSSAQNSSTSYRLLRPNGVDQYVIDHTLMSAEQEQDGEVLRVPILERYLNTNVMISVTTVPTSATRSWKAYYSQTISVECQERTGTIKVTAIRKTSDTPSAPNSARGKIRRTSRAIRGGYVKVYAEMKEGEKQTTFWKDGYTDLVGRFDYATVSTATSSALFGSGASQAGAGNGGLTEVKRFVVFVDGGKEGCVVKTVPVPPM
ncbi:hypothetical protein EDD11_002643 [Mortierella claussenii]|nr:hypothetical protein EDD11_002643 [Mortierella claussenii]